MMDIMTIYAKHRLYFFLAVSVAALALNGYRLERHLHYPKISYQNVCQKLNNDAFYQIDQSVMNLKSQQSYDVNNTDVLISNAEEYRPFLNYMVHDTVRFSLPDKHELISQD